MEQKLELEKKARMDLTDFSEKEYRTFISECGFTDRQIEILNLRRRGFSILQISLYHDRDSKYLPLSTSTIDRELRKIKNKILKVI